MRNKLHQCGKFGVILRGPVKIFDELVPRFLAEAETALIEDGVLSRRCGRVEHEFRDGLVLDFGSGPNEGVFTSRCSQVEALGARARRDR